MKHPESWAVSQVPWQFFCTLTWANEGSFKRPPSPRRQVCAFFAFVREAARVCGVHFKRLMWCLRHETGEMTGREHYHCLLSVVGSEWVRLTTCFYLMDHWDKKLRCGHARVRVFQAALGGVAYTCKDLAESLVGKDRYEFEKFFGTTTALTLRSRFSALSTPGK